MCNIQSSRPLDTIDLEKVAHPEDPGPQPKVVLQLDDKVKARNEFSGFFVLD